MRKSALGKLRLPALPEGAGTVAGLIVSAVAGAAVFLIGSYVRARRGGALVSVPMRRELVRVQIDRLVAWLDRSFGKDWAEQGLDALQRAFKGTPQGIFVQILGSVYKAEVVGRRQQWSGGDKLRYVLGQLGSRGGAKQAPV